MQQTKQTYTVGDLLSIFATTRTSLYQRLNQNNLKQKLISQKHIIKIKNRPYFDDYAFIKIANKFKNRHYHKRSKSVKSNSTNRRSLNKIDKHLKMIANNQSKIMNKIGVHY